VCPTTTARRSTVNRASRMRYAIVELSIPAFFSAS
jgi:hypothetical protein